jgi:DNA-directed RNA polymerase subunit RPC12/RpoP
MDIVFTCDKCSQELSVDESAAGMEIECPSCSQRLNVPGSPPAPLPPPASGALNPMASSAAARAEQPHFKVPTYDKAVPAAPAIEKALTPLEVAARITDKQIKVRTLRHSDHVEVGKDLFDDHVSLILQKIGETNIISISPIAYTHLDLATRQWITDYGVIVVYRG